MRCKSISRIFSGGIVDFASGTFDSVKRVTETSQEIGKKRPARFLKSDGITRPYNLFEAEGWKFLRDLEKGKYSESDTYVTHEEIPSDNRHKEVFLVTNKRILVMNYQTVLGSWSIDWQYLITDITGPPTCVSFTYDLFWIAHPTMYLVGCVIQKRLPILFTDQLFVCFLKM